jgi:imidazolonepropionase-like amidohydrolase
VLTGTGTRLENADVLIVNGKIEAVGPNLSAPAGARVVDASGRWVTPGLIDVHSHLGRLCQSRCERQQRWQRGDRSRHGERLVRARRVAAGSGL